MSAAASYPEHLADVGLLSDLGPPFSLQSSKGGER